MKSEITLADKSVEGEIMAIVNAEPPKTKSAALCSQMMAKNIGRIQAEEEDGGMNPFGPPLTQATGLGWDSSTEPRNREGMAALAKKLNPVVGFWDPLGIVSDDVSPETIGWFRHAEIKHGRVAMAAFVGYCVQANGIHFPWNIQGPFPSGLDTVSFGDISAAGGPADQWDALSTGAKLQILGVVGFLEMWSETSAALELDGQKHYVRGGKPGYFPTLKGRFPHPVPLNLWDPFGTPWDASRTRRTPRPHPAPPPAHPAPPPPAPQASPRR